MKIPQEKRSREGKMLAYEVDEVGEEDIEVQA